MQFTGRGSMLSVHMTDGPIRSQEDAERGNAALRDLFYFDLSRAASGLPSAACSPCRSPSTKHDDDKLVYAVEEFAETRAPLFEVIGSG